MHCKIYQVGIVGRGHTGKQEIHVYRGIGRAKWDDFEMGGVQLGKMPYCMRSAAMLHGPLPIMGIMSPYMRGGGLGEECPTTCRCCRCHAVSSVLLHRSRWSSIGLLRWGDPWNPLLDPSECWPILLDWALFAVLEAVRRVCAVAWL